MPRPLVGVLVVALLVGGCSTKDPDRPAPSPVSSASTTPGEAEEPEARPAPPTVTAQPDPQPVRPADFDVRHAQRAVRHLAGRIGSRHGTSPAFRRAVDWVTRELESQGYRVERQVFDAPAGVSWGVPVPAGRSVNVVARPPGLATTDPHVVVGAHLDTVPRAPGAEDNGSGIGVLLAAAAATADRETRLPIMWVAFGAEEPRGPTDADHHYGSRAYVDSLGPAQRRAVRAMVALDRVGVGDRVPVGSTGESDPVQQALLRAAERAGVPTTPDPFQRSSDHWSFVRAGLPGARLGSTPFAGYHSAGDVPSVVDTEQLERVGR
ncbi:MAG TPA: M28 family peptidase, partial [Micromonosporaceae bacterium]|nr:M28 family peptidase [Micromonosporaceae bacterium]